MSSGEVLTFATQGDEYSYHALAARTIATGFGVKIEAYRDFGPVVRASRSRYPGLGVIAISTVAGTVEDSAREIVTQRPSALPPIVGRVDLSIELALIGSRMQTIEEIGGLGVRCLVQKPAYLQCRDFLEQNLKQYKIIFRESTEAIHEVVRRDNPRWVAIGPSFAAEPLGGHIIGPSQINPEHSVTSFYVLQRDPRQQILPVDPSKTAHRTVISLAHPIGHGEFTKCMELADKLEIGIGRFIPFDIGDVTRHNRELKRGGGLLELTNDLYDPEVTEWCARVNGLVANDGVEGPFGTKKLGSYPWYPEDPLNPYELAEQMTAAAIAAEII